MIRLAFSTVACPSWTLDRVASAAEELGFQGVELRSLISGVAGGGGGTESASFASEPGLISAEKARGIVEARGLDVCSIATGVRFDEPVFPPVLGHALGVFDRPVRELKPYISIAAGIGAPFVRVFGFEAPERTRRGKRLARKRTVERLRLAADACHKTGARLAIENGGDYPRGSDLASLIHEINFPDVAACYSVLPAWEAGEDFASGVAALGNHLAMARLVDYTADGMPASIGSGRVPCRRFVDAVRASRAAQWLVLEWDAAWVQSDADPRAVLGASLAAVSPWLVPTAGRAMSAARV